MLAVYSQGEMTPCVPITVAQDSVLNASADAKLIAIRFAARSRRSLDDWNAFLLHKTARLLTC